MTALYRATSVNIHVWVHVERGVIAEAIYGLLRNKSVYTSFSESGVGPVMRRLSLLGLADAVGIDALAWPQRRRNRMAQAM